MWAHNLLDFGATPDTQHALENKAFTVQADKLPVGLGASRDTVGKASPLLEASTVFTSFSHCEARTDLDLSQI